MHDEALVLDRVLSVLGVGTHLLIGHSDGASIALIHAGTAPRPGLRGLLLEAPHVFTEEHGLASIARIREAYRTTDLRARLARHHTDVDAAFQGWSDVWLSPGFRAWNIEECLPGIRVPSLLVQGTEDEYGTWRQIEAIERGSGGPVRSVALTACGHSPHRDQPEAVLEAAIPFIAAALEG